MNAEQCKFCPGCDQVKAHDGFSRNRSRPDGRAAYCKACSSLQAKRQREGLNEAAKLDRSEKHKAWRLKNPRREYQRAYRDKNRETCNLASRAWRLDNPERNKFLQDRYRRENRDFLKALKQAYRDKNPGAGHACYLKNRDRVLARCKEWKAANPEKVARYASTRRASIIQRTPAWLTSKDFELIEMEYLIAQYLSRETGVPHHVDHIFPLVGRYVSGLHLPANLRVLPGHENLRKGNKWVPE